MIGELMTVEEVASRLRMNPQTVRRWIRRGLLPARKVGAKEWRIASADLERMVQPTPEEFKRRATAVEGLLALRERLRGRGLSVGEAVAESRRELEERSATGRD